jgi:hypothetical protein
MYNTKASKKKTSGIVTILSVACFQYYNKNGHLDHMVVWLTWTFEEELVENFVERDWTGTYSYSECLGESWVGGNQWKIIKTLYYIEVLGCLSRAFLSSTDIYTWSTCVNISWIENMYVVVPLWLTDHLILQFSWNKITKYVRKTNLKITYYI